MMFYDSGEDRKAGHVDGVSVALRSGYFVEWRITAMCSSAEISR
jgi:hypothetical protein